MLHEDHHLSQESREAYWIWRTALCVRIAYCSSRKTFDKVRRFEALIRLGCSPPGLSQVLDVWQSQLLCLEKGGYFSSISSVLLRNGRLKQDNFKISLSWLGSTIIYTLICCRFHCLQRWNYLSTTMVRQLYVVQLYHMVNVSPEYYMFSMAILEQDKNHSLLRLLTWFCVELYYYNTCRS